MKSGFPGERGKQRDFSIGTCFSKSSCHRLLKRTKACCTAVASARRPGNFEARARRGGRSKNGCVQKSSSYVQQVTKNGAFAHTCRSQHKKQTSTHTYNTEKKQARPDSSSPPFTSQEMARSSTAVRCLTEALDASPTSQE